MDDCFNHTLAERYKILDILLPKSSFTSEDEVAPSNLLLPF